MQEKISGFENIIQCIRKMQAKKIPQRVDLQPVAA
jgi:hypothetical protein